MGHGLTLTAEDGDMEDGSLHAHGSGRKAELPLHLQGASPGGFHSPQLAETFGGQNVFIPFQHNALGFKAVKILLAISSISQKP